MLHQFWHKVSDTDNPDNNLGPLFLAVIIAIVVSLVASAIGMA